MSEDTRLKELIINTLSPEQFEPITPSETEIYLVEDDAEYATVEELATKQDTIDDLDTIRTNATTGAGLAPQVAVNTQRIEDLTTAKFPNVVIIGTPHIEGGQVSNYSDTSYLQFPFVDISRGLPFDIYFSFTTSNDITTQQNILDSYFGIALAIQNGKGIMALSSNGSSWDIGTATGTNTLLPNTTYYVKYSWTGTAYSAALSTDDQTYVPDMNLTSSLSPHKTTIFIGGSPNLFGTATAHPFKGTINFTNSRVDVNGITVWEGMADVGLASRANVSLNNLDEVGEARFTDLQNRIDHETWSRIESIGNLSNFINTKQSKEDETLTTTNKTIVGAINELNAKPSASSIDNKTINQNTDNELQAIGIIDNNTSNAIKTWTGTKDEYEALKGERVTYYAWSSSSGTYNYVYTLKELPSIDDDIYYAGEIVGTVLVTSATAIMTSTAGLCNREVSRDIIPAYAIDNNTLYNVKNYGLFLGEEKISTISGYHPPILSCMWSDHLINDIQWLRGDTFSWQSGDVYVTAYNTLVDEYATGTEEVEGNITFKRTNNGYKIATADMESAILNKYNTDGIAWYYILDTVNKRFKLPRMKYKYWKNQSTLPVIGNSISIGLTDGTKNYALQNSSAGSIGTNCITGNYGYPVGTAYNTPSGTVANSTLGLTTDSTKSGIVTDISKAMSELPMYLYFYVGEYTREAIEQTAGLNTELFNSKLDDSGSNLNAQGKSFISSLSLPSGRYIALELGASGATYTAPANGWFSIARHASAVNQYVMITVFKGTTREQKIKSYGVSPTASATPGTFVPCLNGDTVTVHYNTAGTATDSEFFRFVYAEGEQ